MGTADQTARAGGPEMCLYWARAVWSAESYWRRYDVSKLPVTLYIQHITLCSRQTKTLAFYPGRRCTDTNKKPSFGRNTGSGHSKFIVCKVLRVHYVHTFSCSFYTIESTAIQPDLTFPFKKLNGFSFKEYLVDESLNCREVDFSTWVVLLLPGFEPGLLAWEGKMLTTRPWWKQLPHTARIGVAVHCYSTPLLVGETGFPRR